MKIKYKILIPIVILAVGIVSKLGDKVAKSSTESPKLTSKRIMLISHIYGNPYWAIVRDGAIDAAKKRNCSVEYYGPEAPSVEEGIKLIDMSIAAKYDGIITYVLDDSKYKEAIDKASNKGIPVITIDADAEGSKRASYVGTDNIHAGVVAAEETIKKIGRVGEIGIIMGGKSTTNQIERVKGFSDYIKENTNIKIVETESSNSYALEAELMAKRIINNNPKVDCLFCTSALDGTGAAKAILSLNLKDKVTIICFDTLPETLEYIKQGVIYETIAQEPYDMGYESVNKMMDLIEGKKVNDKYLTGVVVVNKQNVNKFAKGESKVN